MRVLSALIAAALIAAPAYAEKPVPHSDETPEAPALVYEKNTYRFAHLYRSEPGTTVEACARACDADNNCAAWSLSPASYNLEARCELKHTPGQASYRPGTASGISNIWQMDPERHSPMRYQVTVPEGHQPAPVPLDETDLMGGSDPKITAVMQETPSPAPTAPPDLRTAIAPSAPMIAEPEPQIVKATPATSVAPMVAEKVSAEPMPTPKTLRGQTQDVVPQYVKQPLPQAEEPHPLYRKPEPRPVAEPVKQAPPSKTIFKDPALKSEAPPVDQPTTHDDPDQPIVVGS
ncbi:MAG: PAN domain-containing protein [Pseudomonadota bacterium]